MIKRLLPNCFLPLLLFATCALAQSPADTDSGMAEAAANQAQQALEQGDVESALEHFMVAHEMDPANEQVLLAAAALAEEVGFGELAIEMYIKAVALAVGNGEKHKVSAYNDQIAGLLADNSGDLEAGLDEAAAVTEDQQEGLIAWQEMASMSVESANAGDVQGALDAQETALLIAQEILGDNHWITATSFRDLGYLNRNLGRVDEAEAYYSQALGIAQELLGDAHPKTIEIQGLLAELYSAASAFEEAGMLFEIVAASYEATLGGQNPHTLNAKLYLAINLETLSLFAEAAETLLGLCQDFDNVYGPYHLQSLACLRQQASVLLSAGRLAKAEEVYNEVIGRMGSSFVMINTMAIDTLSLLGELYRIQGRYQESKDLLSGVVQAGVQINDPQSVYAAKGYLGRVLNDEGHFDRAEQVTSEVLIWGRANWKEGQLNLYNTLIELGAIYQRQGKLGAAEEVFSEAFEGLTVEYGTEHQSTITAMSNLGQIYEKQGLFDLAEPILKDVLALSENIYADGNHRSIAVARNNLALLHESQGNFDEARPLYLQTLAQLSRTLGENHNDTIAIRNNLAFLDMLRLDFANASASFEKVLEQWTVLFGENHQNTLKSMNNLGRAYHKQARLSEAEQVMLRAKELRISSLGAEHLDSIRSMIDIGSVYLDMERLEAADEELTNALRLAEKVLGEQHPYTFDALNALARVKQKRNQLSAAVSLLELGFDRRSVFLDRMLWVTGENAREGYIRLHRPELNHYLDLVSRLDGDDAGKKVINASLKRKGLLLKISSEILQIGQLSLDPMLSDLAAKLELARKNLAALTLSGPTPETQNRHAVVLYELEQEVQELQGQLGRASVRYRSSIAHISADDLEEALTDESALIDFLTYEVDGKKKLIAGIAKKAGGEVSYDVVVYDDLEEVQNIIVEYRQYIQDESADEEEILEAGQQAYQTIWGPIQEITGDIEDLYLIPDGMLNILPFSALVNADELYLLQTHDLHILTSGRDLLPTGYRLAEGKYVILAGPDYDSEDVVSEEELILAKGRRSTALQLGIRGGASGLRGLNFDPLPGAEEEGRMITIRVKQSDKESLVYFKRDAQEQIIVSLESPPEILHLATHGFFLKSDDTLRKRLLKQQRGSDQHIPPPGDNPLLRAGLAFAGINTNAQFLGDIDTANDGVLTALEVLSLNLTGTKLVVLSACETGLGEIHEGEGVYGLRRSFQKAGVAEVVSSLWEVSDAGTQALMTDFYDRILAGEPAREALRATQLALLDSPEWGYPYIWSAFMIVGSYESAGYAVQ